MLKTRIISAIVMLAIVLDALFVFPVWAWCAFASAIALVSCWEWSRFCGFSLAAQRVYLAVSLLLVAIIAVAYLDGRLLDFKRLATTSFLIAAAFWLIAAPVWLGSQWRPSSALAAATGWVVVIPMSLALLTLREVSPWCLLSFAFIVWVADVGAFFVGKAIGKHKLAPAISPGKTIEGAVGGMVGVTLYFFVWKALVSTKETWSQILLSHGWWLLGFFLLLGVLSIIGDLFESWMKRGAGMKDSSNLLPGHGGVLDRIDALTSTLPIAALYVTVTA